mgnify:CR=1 FL=1
MSRPAFLVDGYTEKLIVEELCPGSKVRRIGCNGNTVSIDAIAKLVASQIRLMNTQFHPIFIVIDREDRKEEAHAIAENLEGQIRLHGINETIRVVVCDRMIENWNIADWENLKSSVGNELPFDKPLNTDCCNGKSQLRQHLPNYQETTDGVRLFKSARPSVLVENSPSFRRLHDALYDVNWWWKSKEL